MIHPVCTLVRSRSFLSRSFLFALLLIAGLAAPARAQTTTGSIAGTVTDPLGASVGGATVTLLRDGQAAKTITSDGRGSFTFEGLAEGRYQIQAIAPGLQVRTTSAIFLAAGARTASTVSLPLGPLETAVTVTAAADAVLPSQIGASVTVIDATTLDAIGKPDVLDALRLVPGSSVVQTGGRGGVTSAFIRGGNANFNKVLVDGIPANDIGGGIDLSQFSLAGVEQIEVLREANSVIAGTDALAGVVSVTSRRGHTRIPEASLSIDGGNLATDRESVSVGGVVRRLDYFSEFSHLATDNDAPNNEYRIKTYAGRFGAAVAHNTYVSSTIRWIDRYSGLPNALSFYGMPDDAFQTNRTRLVGFGSQTQITGKWLAAVRVGLSDQRADYVNPTLSGEDVFGVGFGDTVTITGANGYSATGRGALDFGAYDSQTRSARQGLYGQTTYQVSQRLSVSGGGDYEREQAFTDPDADPTATRNNGTAWVEGRGSLADRVSVTAGLGYARIEGFASRYSPRLSVAAYLRKPAAATGLWNDTRLTFNAGKGIKATSASTVDRSLYNLLLKTTEGAALAASAGIGPIGPERGRNLDVGIEQGFWHGRGRARAAYFNNEFFDLVEFVSKNLLPQFGIPSDVAAAAGTGAYVNSQSFKAQGLELSADAMFGPFRLSGSYTYLDAVVTKSLSSSVTPQFNPSFPDIPIGGFTALVGERPFRRPASIGSLLLAYTHGRAALALTGYLAGKADDSTFIVGSDIDFGNSLLLPNQDLNPGYQKVDASGSYRIHPRVQWYGTVENLFDQHYEPTFGFPGLPLNVRTGLTITLGGR